MNALSIGLAIGFAGGFTVAWLLAASMKKDIAALAGKLDGLIAATKKL